MIADTPRENDPATSFLKKLGFGSPVHHVSQLQRSSADESTSKPVPAHKHACPCVDATDDNHGLSRC